MHSQHMPFFSQGYEQLQFLKFFSFEHAVISQLLQIFYERTSILARFSIIPASRE